MSQDKIAFEKWFEQWRSSTWRPLPSDARQDLPEHWAMNAQHHMSIAWQSATALYDERIKELESEVELQRSLNKKLYLSFLELQASNNTLRKALALCNFDASVFDKEVRFEYQEKVRKARLETPAESLQAHDDEVIEKCAKVCDEYWTNIDCKAAIRALKGK